MNQAKALNHLDAALKIAAHLTDALLAAKHEWTDPPRTQQPNPKLDTPAPIGAASIIRCGHLEEALGPIRQSFTHLWEQLHLLQASATPIQHHNELVTTQNAHTTTLLELSTHLSELQNELDEHTAQSQSEAQLLVNDLATEVHTRLDAMLERGESLYNQVQDLSRQLSEHVQAGDTGHTSFSYDAGTALQAEVTSLHQQLATLQNDNFQYVVGRLNSLSESFGKHLDATTPPAFALHSDEYHLLTAKINDLANLLSLHTNLRHTPQADKDPHP